MNRLSELEYLGLSPAKRKLYDIGMFFVDLPRNLLGALKKIPLGIWKALCAIGGFFKEIGGIFARGDWKTRLSFFIMGFGQFFRRQIGRGIIFLLMEITFVCFMVFFGFNYLADMGTLGTVAVEKTLNEYGLEILTYKDNSLKILLYGVLTIFFVVGFVFTWVINVKQNGLAQQLIEKGIRPKAFKDDITEMMGSEIHIHGECKDGKSVILRVQIADMSDEEQTNLLKRDTIAFTIRERTINLFDTQDGRNLAVADAVAVPKAEEKKPSEKTEKKKKSGR